MGVEEGVHQREITDDKHQSVCTVGSGEENVDQLVAQYSFGGAHNGGGWATEADQLCRVHARNAPLWGPHPRERGRDSSIPGGKLLSHFGKPARLSSRPGPVVPSPASGCGETLCGGRCGASVHVSRSLPTSKRVHL